MFKLNTGFEEATKLEIILLGWWVWAFLALVLNSAAPGYGGILLYPITLPLSLFLNENALATATGMFMSFSWLALIIGGIEYSRRKRRLKRLKSDKTG